MSCIVGAFLREEKLTVFCIFMQYDIRQVLNIKSQSMPVEQEPLKAWVHSCIPKTAMRFCIRTEMHA